MKDYVFGKGGVWRGDDGRWQTAATDEANQLINAKIETLGMDGAREWCKARHFVIIDEPSRLALWRKWVVRDAATAICDRRVAAAFPKGTNNLTDMDFFELFAPWASFDFELCAADMEVAKKHFGHDLDADERAALHREVEFTAIGYCGL